MCSVVLQSGHVCDMVLIGSILCLYCYKNGDLPVRSCATILRVFLGSVCSSLLMWEKHGCYLTDDFVWCFAVDVCVDYVGVSVFEMLLYCVFKVFCVLIVV